MGLGLVVRFAGSRTTLWAGIGTGRLQVHNHVTALLSLQRGRLGLTTGDEFEGGLTAEILEVRSRGEHDVYRFNVRGTEALQGISTCRGEAYPKVTQFAQLYLVAVQQLFDDTQAGVTEDAPYCSATEHPVVAGNVVNEI